MSGYWKTVWCLGGMLAIAQFAYLQRVPGLLGDEASEGENVYEKLHVLAAPESEKNFEILIAGERSYIGPLIDYVRVPFIAVFGYTALALRVVAVIASLLTFWLAAVVLLRLFGEKPALFGLVFGFFSPLYLSYQRLGWAITLFPLFVFLILFFLTGNLRYKYLLAGLAAGLGLHNHILFLPTIVAIALVWVGAHIRKPREILRGWPAVVGFVAGFGTQFAMLFLKRDDQGDPAQVATLFWERMADMWSALPLYLSGSAFVASYTGVEFSNVVIWMGTAALLLLAVLPFFSLRTRSMAALWLAGLIVHILVMQYFIDRFNLRYFFLFAFGVWVLAGVGVGTILERIGSLRLRGVPARWNFSEVFVALLLIAWSTSVVLIPFLRTGGSTADFSLGNRTNSAAAQVDVRPLVNCLRGKGSVGSEDVHIWNRLQYMSHEYPDLEVVPEAEVEKAAWRVEYRNEKSAQPGDLCPELVHFRIISL